jgi:hypothetical protein
MEATQPGHVRREGALDQSKIAALLTIYEDALGELRSWRDPRVAELIGQLESLQQLLGRLSRLND